MKLQFCLLILLLCGVSRLCIGRTRISMKKPGFCPPPVLLTGPCEVDPGSQYCISHNECPGEKICCREKCNKICKFPLTQLPQKHWDDWAIQNKLNPNQNQTSNLFVDRPVSRNQRNRNAIMYEMTMKNEESPFILMKTDGNTATMTMNPGCNAIVFQTKNNESTISVDVREHCVIGWEHRACHGNFIRITPHESKKFQTISTIRSFAFCDSEKCTKKGYFPKPGSCDKFFRCVENGEDGKLLRIDLQCPPDQIYDPNFAKCNPLDQIIHPLVVSCH